MDRERDREIERGGEGKGLLCEYKLFIITHNIVRKILLSKRMFYFMF